MLEPLALLLSTRKHRHLIDEFVMDRLFLEPFRRDTGIELDATAERTVLPLLNWVATRSHLGARPCRPSTTHAR